MGVSRPKSGVYWRLLDFITQMREQDTRQSQRGLSFERTGAQADGDA